MNDHAGFTLIELIVVLATVALFFGFSLGPYTKFNEQKKLEGDTKKFLESLEMAKKKINAGDKPNSQCLLSSVSISYQSSSNAYSLVAQCPTDTTIIPEQKLSSSDTFTTSGQVVFFPFGAPTTYTSSCILLKNSSRNICRQVSIEQSGVVTQTTNDTCECQ